MKAKGISTKQVQEFINNEEERFNDQPAIINNGDSKETSISYEGKTIKIKEKEQKKHVEKPITKSYNEQEKEKRRKSKECKYEMLGRQV